jgi:glycosyltransferase involved in cell wall biosynthesis
VPAVQPFLAAADLVVAPLALARGIQNKVLEAMAMARPVLLTPEAATGIDAEDGLHWRVAESDAAFASAALDLLSDPAAAGELAAAARRFVIERMSWPAMLARLPRILSASGEGRRDAA